MSLSPPPVSLNAKDFSLPIASVIESCPEIKNWLDENNKIDLGNSLALYHYNKCLFKILDDIDLNLDITNDQPINLIPTAGLRRAIVSTVISTIKPKTVIEIGTGASAIIALLLAKNNIQVIATEINEDSIKTALKQIQLNKLESNVTLVKSEGILNYLEHFYPIDCVVSLPPYYAANTKDLPKSSKGFMGTDSELYSFGADSDFSITLLKEWATIRLSTFLVILWKNLESVEKALQIMKTFQVENQIIEIKAGTRIRYLTLTKKCEEF